MIHRLRSLLNAARSGVVILLYHRVTALPRDPQWLCVPPAQFAEHLDVLRRHYRPLSLADLTRRLAAGSLPRRSVVVTFDDGYADNLHEARPLLERFDVPATVFVATGKLGGPSEFWWDELEDVLLAPRPLPATLDVTLNGQTRSWTLGPLAEARPERWNVAVPSSPTPRHQAYRELAPLIRVLDPEAREAVLDRLACWAGVPRAARPSHRVMEPDEVVRLAEGGLVEVGAHTVEHPVLATLPADRQRQEIRASKARLEEILGCPVTSFSYPFGGRSDYTGETVAAVREAGFTCSCSNFPGVVRRGADLFQLPRSLARDWDGDEFHRLLDEWFRA